MLTIISKKFYRSQPNCKHTPEWRCLLAVIFPAEITMPTEPIDWEAFFTLIHRQKVALLVYRARHLLPAIPTILTRLTDIAKKKLATQMKQQALLCELQTLCEDAAIPMLAFKGLTAAVQLYGDHTAKVSGDIDVLVSPDDVTRVKTLLLNHGYSVSMDFIKYPYLEKKAREYRYTYILCKAGVTCELHWRLFCFPHQYRVPFATLWERRTYVTIGTTRIATLGMTDFLNYTLLHAHESVWMRLTWYVDCYHALQHATPTLSDARINKAYQEFCAISAAFFHNERPKKWAVRYGMAMMRLNHKPYFSWLILLKRLCLTDIRTTWYSFFYMALTSPNDWAVWPLPRPLFPLYYLLRPYLIWKRRGIRSIV